MAGYYRVRLAEGVHDDLYAKALVLEKDSVKAVIAACDLVGVSRPIVEKARELAQQATGIPGAHIMISATHSHTGPELGARLRGVDDATMRLARNYIDGLPAKIAESVKLADASLAPARVRAAIGREDSLSFIRRYQMKDGTVGWNPGKRNPNILRPIGAIDPDVPVVAFDALDGKPLATYVNFACHLDTVGGLEFSADYAYTLAKLIGEVKGPDMLTVFTIGTAGNINHVDVNSAEPQKGHGEAARIGTVLAAAVLKACAKLEALDAGSLHVASEIVKIPTDRIEPGDVEKARKIVAAYGTPAAGAFLDQVRAFKVLDIEERHGQPLEAEVQVIALGKDLAWIGLPGEIFVDLGRAIKIASPFRFTIVAELANGAIGYVPDRKAYSEGNYEVVNTRCAPGGGEMMVEAARRLLSRE
jgi:neutral ceramidase